MSCDACPSKSRCCGERCERGCGLGGQQLSWADSRGEVIRVCRLMHERRLVAAFDGNVSFRLGAGRFLVTPSGVHKGFLRPEHLVVVDGDGKVIEGSGSASSEISMHLAVMKCRPDANAVVHAHAPSAVAMSLLRHPQLNGVLSEVSLAFGELQVLPYERPGTVELADVVAAGLEKHDIVILERHGTVAVGRSLEEAYAFTEGLEHAAHILWMAHCVQRPSRLGDGEMRALGEIHARTRGPASRMAW